MSPILPYPIFGCHTVPKSPRWATPNRHRTIGTAQRSAVGRQRVSSSIMRVCKLFYTDTHNRNDSAKLIDEDEWIDVGSSSKKKKRRKSGRKSSTKTTKDLEPMPPLHEVRGFAAGAIRAPRLQLSHRILFRRKQILSMPPIRMGSGPGRRQGAHLI